MCLGPGSCKVLHALMHHKQMHILSPSFLPQLSRDQVSHCELRVESGRPFYLHIIAGQSSQFEAGYRLIEYSVHKSSSDEVIECRSPLNLVLGGRIVASKRPKFLYSILLNMRFSLNNIVVLYSYMQS
jgi:hypothetical protein